MGSDVVYAQMWTFTDWWAAQVRIALRTLTGRELADRLDFLIELAGDRL